MDETSKVNELSLENLGDEEVFIQAGDIVKGGKQDRVIGVSLLVPPQVGQDADLVLLRRAGPLDRARVGRREPIHERGQLRSLAPGEDGDLRGCPLQRRAPICRTIARWTTHRRVSRRSGVTSRKCNASCRKMSGRRSPRRFRKSSLQLALENEKLADAKQPYLKALKDAAEKENDIVGYVFAVNGKINSGDVYPSNGLFKKMWSKLLNSSVTEAIGEKNGEAGAPPTTEQVLAFLDEAEKGKAQHPPGQ